jgi:hypothetical protein
MELTCQSYRERMGRRVAAALFAQLLGREPFKPCRQAPARSADAPTRLDRLLAPCPPWPIRSATTAWHPIVRSTRRSRRSRAATGARSPTCRRSTATPARCSRSARRAGCATAATAAAGWPFFGQFIAHDTALAGDPRNDVHVFISQLHLGLLGAHNRLVERLREDGIDEADCFDAARRAAMWHYQWVIVEDFLPALLGPELAEEVKDPARRCYRPEGLPIMACPPARRSRVRWASSRSRARRRASRPSAGRARRRCGSTSCARPTCAAAASAWARSAGA